MVLILFQTSIERINQKRSNVVEILQSRIFRPITFANNLQYYTTILFQLADSNKLILNTPYLEYLQRLELYQKDFRFQV